ncbi:MULTISPECIES: pyridoxal 5'-phosphate synthase glutaminase subunit PdxT [Shouchella]|uniref:Pyridoxal 5'-phosphate synthase subunit PdxT n=2 Tax=Shouchella TaxID=2893057 RepID=A0ABY7W2E5_9BACI|nr:MULTISPECIES: pyridoxal 5'-phosphate synthase glutaminase subunit PdxT [Shouchella]MED4128444.1 pyridoxal 5'-phosphate synthase glutaminase subunit PdxT [Shouchella miscanthi]WDF02619.1 pyridoxal 5'-phosphate synthase glutaminase subunit PdxT [Shouchella hunanensis]
MVKVGVLALQGAVSEHIKMIEENGATGIAVKRVEQLEAIDGLIIPGGESTTMRRLIDNDHFFEPLKAFGKKGRPVFGTCAGMILMARSLTDQKEGHLGFINMVVERNAFGRQRESFEAHLSVMGISEYVEAVFIRAPLVQEIGKEVEVVSEYDDEIVAVRQGPFLACSFHPELTDDPRMHQLFIQMVKEHK